MQRAQDSPPQFDRSVFPFETVSVTGGTGTVGSQFVKVLLAQFPDVRRVNTTCRPDSPRAYRIPEADRVNVVKGSINDLEVLKAMVEGAEVVYHLAAWLANTPLPTMLDVYITNSLSTGVLSRLCARRGKPMVFTSSHSVYFAGDYEGHIRADTYDFRDDFIQWIDEAGDAYSRLIDDIIDGREQFAGARDAVHRIHDEYPPPFDPKIYDDDSYHIYCLTKLLAERFVLDDGHPAPRLANVYGPGDESTQAVAEACQRLLEAEPGDRIEVLRPFKKLVPNYLGDIITSLVRAGTLELPEDEEAVFTVASQSGYMREDELLRTVAESLNRIRGTDHEYDIEELAPEEETAFTYDLSRMKRYLVKEEEMTPFGEGVEEQLRWLIERQEGAPPRGADVVIDLADAPNSGG